jgi:hypothetical protein
MKKHQQPCLAAAGKKEIKNVAMCAGEKLCSKIQLFEDFSSLLWRQLMLKMRVAYESRHLALFAAFFVAQLYFLAFLPQPTLLSHVVPLSCDLRGYILRTRGTHWREYNFPRGHLKAIKVKADCIINFGMREVNKNML